MHWPMNRRTILANAYIRNNCSLTRFFSFDGWHGGPTISESNVPLMFSMPGTAFVDSDGNPINAPPQLLNGFTSGVESTGISPDSQLRNWHLTPILEEIITQFRNE